MDGGQLQQINDSISEAMQTASVTVEPELSEDMSLLENYIQRLLNHPRQ